jgi:hypothetical protein
LRALLFLLRSALRQGPRPGRAVLWPAIPPWLGHLLCWLSGRIGALRCLGCLRCAGSESLKLPPLTHSSPPLAPDFHSPPLPLPALFPLLRPSNPFAIHPAPQFHLLYFSLISPCPPPGLDRSPGRCAAPDIGASRKRLTELALRTSSDPFQVCRPVHLSLATRSVLSATAILPRRSSCGLRHCPRSLPIPLPTHTSPSPPIKGQSPRLQHWLSRLHPPSIGLLSKLKQLLTCLARATLPSLLPIHHQALKRKPFATLATPPCQVQRPIYIVLERGHTIPYKCDERCRNE